MISLRVLGLRKKSDLNRVSPLKSVVVGSDVPVRRPTTVPPTDGLSANWKEWRGSGLLRLLPTSRLLVTYLDCDLKRSGSLKHLDKTCLQRSSSVKSSVFNQNRSVTISSEYRATIQIDNNDDCAPASHARGHGLSPVGPSPKRESVTHVSGKMCYIRLRPFTGSE